MENLELEFEKQKVETLTELLGIGYWCLNLNDQSLFLSHQFLESLNEPALIFDGKLETFLTWFNPEDRASFDVALKYHLVDGIPFDMNMAFKLSQNSVQKYATKGRAIRAADGTAAYFIGIFTGNGLGETSNNLDFQSLLADHQRFLLHNAKMSALGEMASGMAHEINNPLTIIKGTASSLLRMIDKGELSAEKIREIAKKIDLTTDRAAKIIKGLKNFSRDGNEDPFVKTSIATIVDDTLSFCQEKLKNRGISLNISPIPPKIVIQCRASQISQVILNLLSNAGDAIAEHPEPWIKLDVTETEDKVEISITDCGNGIPKEIAEKIMQPFFTTKAVGVGTGLGLSISKGLIDAHKGQITIDEQCPNTRFIVSLPKLQ